MSRICPYIYIQVRQLEEASSQHTVFDPTPGAGGGGRRARGGLTGAAEEEAQAPNTVDSTAQMRKMVAGRLSHMWAGDH